MRKYIITVLVVLFSSCQNHKMYFDIEKQELISCNKKDFRSLGIDDENDAYLLIWKDTINDVPQIINFNNLPKGYEVTMSGMKTIKSFKLKPNMKYELEKYGGGQNSHIIKIWTDATGKVYKTTHPNCDGAYGVPVSSNEFKEKN